jgi:hypothetical protein
MAGSSSFIFMSFEGDGWAPLSYSGKIFSTKDGVVKVLAQPFIYSSNGYLSISKLNYKWYINDELITEGIGQNIFRYRFESLASYGEKKVKVRVLSDDIFVAEKEISVYLIEPKVVIIAQSGTINQTIHEINVNQEQITLQAFPYFFSTKQLSDIKSTWRVNNQSVKSNLQNNLLLSLYKSGTTMSVELILERISNVFVRGGKSINIGF